MSPQKKPTAFTSIRIIGKKAQDMINRAKVSIPVEEKGSNVKRPQKKKPNSEVMMHISLTSVIEAAFIILAIYGGAKLISHLDDKIILLLLAVFVAMIIDPGVKKLEQWGVPRALGVIVHYLLAIFLFLFLLVSLVPAIAQQLNDIGTIISEDLEPLLEDPTVTFSFLNEEMNATLNMHLVNTIENINVERITAWLQETSVYLADIASSIFKFIASLVIVLVMGFFMQMEKERIFKWIRGFVPLRFRKYADLKADAINTKIGQWMRGELMLMASIFTLTYIALLILDMDYALTLAILAGFCELIPAVGPLFAAIPAILIAGTQKGIVWVFIIAGTYYIIQWCENNLLVPLIMKRAVGLSPVAILFAMLVGISFGDVIHPVLGVMLAVPVTTIIAIFLEDWRESRNAKDE